MRESGSRSTEQIDLSVVIPARNAEEWIGEQLEALSKQLDGACEVLLADNGSTDGTNQIFRSYTGRAATRWEVVDASAIPGQAYARNVGAKEARGELLVFVDADDVVAPGYLQAMRKALAEHEFVAAMLDDVTLNQGWTKPRNQLPQAREIPVTLAFLPAAGGGTLGIRRSLFERLGGFDTGTSPGEDADLCWRAELNGTHLALVTDAVVQYRRRNTFRGFFRRGFSDGIARTALYCRFRDKGMPRRHWRTVLSFHGGVLVMAWRTRSRSELAELCETIGVRLGLIRGSFKNRVWYL